MNDCMMNDCMMIDAMWRRCLRYLKKKRGTKEKEKKLAVMLAACMLTADHAGGSQASKLQSTTRITRRHEHEDYAPRGVLSGTLCA